MKIVEVSPMRAEELRVGVRVVSRYKVNMREYGYISSHFMWAAKPLPSYEFPGPLLST